MAPLEDDGNYEIRNHIGGLLSAATATLVSVVALFNNVSGTATEAVGWSTAVAIGVGASAYYGYNTYKCMRP